MKSKVPKPGTISTQLDQDSAKHGLLSINLCPARAESEKLSQDATKIGSVNLGPELTARNFPPNSANIGRTRPQ